MNPIILLLFSILVCHLSLSNTTTFRRLFINWQSGYYRQKLCGAYEYISQQVQDKLIHGHLSGIVTVGTPILNELNCVKTVVFDVDSKHASAAKSVTKRLIAKLRAHGLKVYVFHSGRRGYHVYLFVLPVTLARVAREFGHYIVGQFNFPVGTDIEVFPKQDELLVGDDGTIHPGSQVKWPLGKHKKGTWSEMVDDDLNPIPREDAWAILERVKPQPLPDFELTPVQEAVEESATPVKPPTKTQGGTGKRSPHIRKKTEGVTILDLEPGLEGAPDGCWKGGQVCPVDKKTSNPSFAIYGNWEAFRCHRCIEQDDAQGDIIDFVKWRKGFTYREAVAHIAELSGGGYVGC